MDNRHNIIKEGLKQRLNKLGPIRVDDAWQMFKEDFQYEAIRNSFRIIMEELVKEGRADTTQLKGVYFIFKQQQNGKI